MLSFARRWLNCTVQFALLASLLVWSVGCGDVGLPKFDKKLLGISRSSSQSFKWASAVTVDAGAGPSATPWTVNNDLSASCTGGSGGLVGNAANFTLGCMQPASLAYADDRWFLAFTQNYLWTAGATKYSAFVNMTSLLTGVFGTLGFGLGIIDNGLGIDGVTAAASSRYIRFATLPSGDVIAVFWSEIDPTPVRTVFASVYSASTKTWGGLQQLSTTNAPTDRASDYGASYRTHLCRPAVAAAGDGTAMVAWCEGPAAGVQPSTIKYAIYSNGSWTGAAGGVVLVNAASTLGFPGYSATFNDFSGVALTTLQEDDTPADIFSGSITVSSAVTPDIATVAAVEGVAGPGEFSVVRDSDGDVMMCESLQNMINSMLAKEVYRAGVAQGVSLSGRGVSMRLNPACSNTTSSTWTVGAYYNKNLANTFRDVDDTDATVNENDVARIQVREDGAVDGMGDPLYSTPAASTIFADQTSWPNSAMVDIAGDDYGNFVMVRSVVSPYFEERYVTEAAGVSSGRILVGHEYVAGSGWRARSGTVVGDRQPNTSILSRTPTCYTGTTYAAGTGYAGNVFLPCSVRNPKVLLSGSGQGLVLFYQSQFDPYTASATQSPTRLWYSTYGSATGFSSSASILDPDTRCTIGSVANDVPVCETGKYAAAAASPPVGTGDTLCQSVGEPTTSTMLSVTHDVPPIAASMNADGQAVVAFHKYTYSSSLSTCQFIGTYVTAYDRFNGFGNLEQVDDGTQNTMHAQVAINSRGDIAVVWEQIDSVPTNKYVYLRTKISGVWSDRKVMNEGMLNPSDSMMPSVAINDDGEIVVSFTYGATAATRRQYVRQYFYY
ncbi:MAG: hypothetical protein AB1540_06165 [Bdellovibrionota bacterium]